MRKTCFFFILGVVLITPCFSQNMLFLGGEYNLNSPVFWSAGAGFNFKLFNNYIQNDFMLNFGSIWAKEAQTKEQEEEDDTNKSIRQQVSFPAQPGKYPMKFLFYLRDSLFFSFDWRWVGLRTGIFGSFGLYDIPDFPTVYDLFFNGGLFAGITIMPKSLISVALDFCPGYAVALRFDKGPAINESGFSLSPSLTIRLNLDKL